MAKYKLFAKDVKILYRNLKNSKISRAIQKLLNQCYYNHELMLSTNIYTCL